MAQLSKAAAATTTKIIERCQISPPPGSVPPTTLPLTFFDMALPRFNPKRIFFFDFPHPTHHFMLTALPKLKHSLSLALRHFFPFAADFISPPPPQKPHLLFSEGGSVSFAVAESTADFQHLISDDPRDTTDYNPFFPTLPRSSDDGASPLLSVQATVFPNSGVAIGLTYNHVAADGRSVTHFVKSWAFLCRTLSSQGSSPVDLESPPSHDREAILNSYGLQPIFLKQYWELTSGSDPKVDTAPRQENKARATVIMGPAHIAKLKKRVSAQCEDKGEALTWHLSTFAVTVAYTWVQIIKSQPETIRDKNETCHFGFVADCRNQKGLEDPIPETYFGNCLALCNVSLKRSEVVGENGVFHAAKAIGEKVREFHGAPLRGADKWMSAHKKIPVSESFVTVAGSPKFGVYETDFGWGRPRKSQMHDMKGISLAECKEGGIEIGLSLDKDQMNTFIALFQRGLELL